MSQRKMSGLERRLGAAPFRQRRARAVLAVGLLAGLVTACGDDDSGGTQPDASVDCTPGDFVRCDGDEAVFCTADATGTERVACGPAGCNAEQERCNECEPDTVQCQGDDLVTCTVNGTVASTQPCAHGCSEQRGECNQCTPQEGYCDGDDLVTCSAEGIAVREACIYGCDAAALACKCVADECLDQTTLQRCGPDQIVSGVEVCQYGCNTDGSPHRCNECEPGGTWCVDDVLHYCGSDGRESGTESCPLGCNATDPAGARCNTFTPTFADEADLHSGTLDIVLSLQNAVLDTGAAVLTIGNDPPIPLSESYVRLQQDANGDEVGPPLLVVPVRQVDIPSMSALRVVGSRGLVLVASQEIRIDGLLDASAHGHEPGPGGRARGDAPWSYPGIPGDGGDSASCSLCTLQKTGSGGGGYGAPGGAGGLLYDPSYQACAGGTGGGTFGSELLEPATGGFAGGNWPSYGAVDPGAGGGLIVLVSRRAVRIEMGLMPPSGKVDVSGGGGQYRGGGGGSGGTVLLEAPTVEITGRVWARGGGGACEGSETSSAGQDGRDGGDGCSSSSGPTHASGGHGGLSVSRPNDPSGGDGELGGCAASPLDYSAGGGGGGAGRFRALVGPAAGSFIQGNQAEILAVPCGGSVWDCVGTLVVY